MKKITRILLLSTLFLPCLFTLKGDELLVAWGDSVTILLDSKPKKIVATNKSIDFKVRGSRILVTGRQEGVTSEVTIFLAKRRIKKTIRVVDKDTDTPTVYDLRLKQEESEGFQTPTLFYSLAQKKPNARVISKGKGIKATISTIYKEQDHLLLRLRLEGERCQDFSEALIYGGEGQDTPVEVTQKTLKKDNQLVVLLACKADISASSIQITLLDMAGEELVRTKLNPKKYV